MEYTGKLYGKIGSEYFDTGRTSEDFDAITEALKSSNARVVLISNDIASLAAEINADIVISREDGEEYNATILMEHRDAMLDAIGFETIETMQQGK